MQLSRGSAVSREITSKHHGDFYCLNYLHTFTTENKRECHKKVCENLEFCNVVMPSEDTKMLEFNQYQKFDNAPFIIYADLEWLIEKIEGCKNNPEKSSTTKVGKHISSGVWMPKKQLMKFLNNDREVED